MITLIGTGGSRAAPTALLVLFGVFASAQTPQPPARNGVITGQVVDAATGKPVGAVIMSISGPGISMRVTSASARGSLGAGVNPLVPRVMTGADGRFMFRVSRPAASRSRPPRTATRKGPPDDGVRAARRRRW